MYIQTLVCNSDSDRNWNKICTNELRRLTYLYDQLLMTATTDYQTIEVHLKRDVSLSTKATNNVSPKLQWLKPNRATRVQPYIARTNKITQITLSL